MNGKETIVGNCLLYTLIFYTAVIHLFCGNFDSNLKQKQFPVIKQTPSQVITEIVIQLDSGNCPYDYVSLIYLDSKNLQNQYLCKDGKIYQKDASVPQDCQQLIDFFNQQIKFVSLGNLSGGLSQKLLICGKLEDFEQLDKDDYQHETDSQNDFNGELDQDGQRSDVDSNAQNSTNINQRFLSKKTSKKPKNSSSGSSCSYRQKACQYKKSIYCIDKKSKCPVSKIEIFSSSQQDINNLDNKMIQVSQNIFFKIERESELYQPLVELILAQDSQICSQAQLKDSQKSSEIKPNEVSCNNSESLHRNVFQTEHKISLKKLLEVNQISIPNQFKDVYEDLKFNIYQKENDVDLYNCIDTTEHNQYLDDIEQAKLLSEYHLKFSFFLIVLLILALIGSNPLRQVQEYINSQKLHKYSLIVSLFNYFNILWLIIAIKYQLGEINKQLRIYSSRDCLEDKAISEINLFLFRNQLSIQIGFVIAFTYLPLLMYVSWKLINKFCWMRKVTIIPQTPIEMQFLSKKKQTKQ